MYDTTDILQFLECTPGKPGIRQLNRLIQAYVRKVPWESVFRIAKRAATPDQSQCPRWPQAFWRDAICSGGGGTCYESNYAFFHLLQQLGYRGYLTINDMGDVRGCHAAIVVQLQDRKVLVDVGIPLLVALPIHPNQATHRPTWLHTYTVQPDGPNRYQILRSRHPKPNIYTLNDIPVDDAAYRQIVEQDYGEAGQFLDRVVLVKIIGEQLWRFNSSEQPYRLEAFGKDDRQEIPVPPEALPGMLANKFQMDQRTIDAALLALNIS